MYVDGSRWKAMMCYDWTVEDKAKLTTDGSVTPLWVAPMNQINFKALSDIKNKANSKLKSSRNPSPGIFSRVVGVSPTGWSHKPSGGELLSIFVLLQVNPTSQSLINCTLLGNGTTGNIAAKNTTSSPESIVSKKSKGNKLEVDIFFSALLKAVSFMCRKRRYIFRTLLGA